MDERQWLFRNPVSWLVTPVLLVATAGVLLAARDDPGSTPLAAALPGALGVLFAFAHLRVRLVGDELVVAFFPFWRRTVPLGDVREPRVVEYDWWRYGGWGIRFGEGAVAYSVWGRSAVRCGVAGAKRDLVFTTAQPEAWVRALGGQP